MAPELLSGDTCTEKVCICGLGVHGIAQVASGGLMCV